MTFNTLALRRTAIAAAVMLAAMAVLWWSLWQIAATQYGNFIDRWISIHRPAGYEIHYAARRMGGFPRRLTLHFTDFVLENSDGVRIHSKRLDLSTLPWRWRRLKVSSAQGFDIFIPFGGKTDLTVTADAASGRVDLGHGNSDWRILQIAIMGARARWAQQPFFSAGRLTIMLSRPDKQPASRKDTGLTLAGGAADLVLPPGLGTPFGPRVAKLDMALRVMGAVPDPRKKDSVAAWSKNGGLVNFDRLELGWGPLLFAAKGALDLDDDLQPEGVFVSRIGNQKKVLDALMDHGEIPKRDAGMLGMALNLFAKPAEIEGTQGIEVPITAQWDGLFLGPVKVFEFPAIRWGAAEAAAPAVAAPSAASPALPAMPVPAVKIPAPVLPPPSTSPAPAP